MQKLKMKIKTVIRLMLILQYSKTDFTITINGRDFPGQRERSPDYQKLRARVTHIWGNRRGQPNRSAMEGSHPGGTAFRITVTPTPGKYAVCWSIVRT